MPDGRHHGDDAVTHQIGEVAELVGLSLRTIRHYEEVDLVPPSGRSSGGFRLYTDADIARLRLVKHMKPLDFTLEETDIDLFQERVDADRAGLPRADVRAGIGPTPVVQPRGANMMTATPTRQMAAPR